MALAVFQEIGVQELYLGSEPGVWSLMMSIPLLLKMRSEVVIMVKRCPDTTKSEGRESKALVWELLSSPFARHLCPTP